jgi:tetratricopeptide (TPR) repeat protein
MSKIFVSYSSQDRAWRDTVVTHLEVLGHSLCMTVWDDRYIGGGADYRTAISTAIADTDVAVLLVSKNFLTSSFIQDSELPPLLQRERDGKTTIIPFLVDHCVWQAQSWLERRNMRPSPPLPARDYPNHEEALTRLAREVWLLLRRNQLRAVVGSDDPSVRIMTELDRIENQLHKCWDTVAQPARIEVEMKQAEAEARAEVVRRRERHRARVAGARPRSLMASFKDRVAERSRIGELLAAADTRIVQVVGRGGMGKTALACQVLQSIENGQWPQGEAGPDVSGIVYLSTRTRGISLDRIYSECLAVLPPEERRSVERLWAEPGASVDDKVQRLLEAMHGGVFLILLDNVEDLLDSDDRLTDQGLHCLLMKSLQMDNGVRFLITSRRQIAIGWVGAAVQQVPLLAGLPVQEASELVRELLQADGTPGPQWPDRDVQRIAERFHGVPRALELAVGALLNDPLLTVDEFLKDAGHGLTEGSESIVRALAEQTYGRMDPDALHVMQALAVFGCPVLQVGVDYLLRAHFPGIDVPTVLRRLCRTHLASADRQSKRISLHPIDLDFLYGTLSDSGAHGRRALHLTAAEYYVSRQIVGPLEWDHMAEVDPHIQELEHLIRAGEHDRAARKLGTIANRLTWRGFADRVRALLALVGSNLHEPEARLAFELAACSNMTVLGPVARAVLHGRRALRLAHALGDAAREAQSHWKTALAYRYAVGSTERAVHHYRAAIAANLAAGTEERNPWIMGELCISLCYEHKAADAVAVAYEAQAILASPVCERLNAEQRFEVTAIVLQALGFALCMAGDTAAAIQASQEAIELWTERRQPAQLCGYALHVIALAHASAVAYDDARQRWEDGRDLAKAQGQPRLEGICDFNLSLLAYLAGDRIAALTLAEEAVLALARMRQSEPALALVAWLRAPDSAPTTRREALRRCAKASWECPDFYGYRLFEQWAAEVRKTAPTSEG